MIGAVIGLLVARLGIPSFVVTLAFFLGLQGVLLVIIGEGGTIGYENEVILALNNDPMPVWLGWTLAVVGLAAFAGLTWRLGQPAAQGRARGPAGAPVGDEDRRPRHPRARRSWPTCPGSASPNPELKSIKGVPLVVAIVVGLLVVLTYVLNAHPVGPPHLRRRRQRRGRSPGRHQRAPGQAHLLHDDSATWRRSPGCSSPAATTPSRPTTGGGTTLLYAVGAAVIGGTSLFGGKGRVSDAVIGGFVIAIIANGMGLMRQSTGNVYMITGLVLLVAASVDAISRRRASASGRA